MAFAELYRLSSGKLYAVALRILRNPDRAGEALQEAYLRIWTQAGRYDPLRGSPMHWMTSIVRHVSIDAVRHYASIPEEGTDLAEVEIPVAPRGTDALDLARCMERLDALQARAIHLAMHFGLSHSEIAATLGQPLGTVKSAIRRGLAKLRSCLEVEPSNA